LPEAIERRAFAHPVPSTAKRSLDLGYGDRTFRVTGAAHEVCHLPFFDTLIETYRSCGLQ